MSRCALLLPFLWFFAQPTTTLGQFDVDGCAISVGDFRTQTQGGWGADACNGSNPACDLEAGFDAAFPNGVTLGVACEGGQVWTFTTSDAVAAFLPAGSTAALLSNTATDPEVGGSVLAGQLLAAKISLGMDLADPGFGASEVNLGDLAYASGPYQGWTVSELVAWADQVIGGCSESTEGLSDLVEALTAFNEAFVDGTTTTEALVLPGCLDDDDDDVEDCGEPGSDWSCWVEVMCPVSEVATCGGDADVTGTGAPLALMHCCCGAGSVQCTLDTLDVEWSWVDVWAGGCPASLERTFSATVVIEGDTLDLACTQAIAVTDTTAPELVCPADVSLSCGELPTPENAGWATATDACSTVLVTYADVVDVQPGSVGTVVLRTWTATDACSNTASCVQTIGVADVESPILDLICPPDTTLFLDGACAGDLPTGLTGEPEVTATDDMDVDPMVEVAYQDLQVGACEGAITVYRNWSVTATDDCGNATTATCTQVLQLLDQEAPTFASTCGLADGDVIEVCCTPEGTVDLPDPCIVAVADNCGATVVYSEEATGYAPMNGAVQACAATQPDAVANGLTCSGDTAHALRLFCFPGSDEQSALFTAVGAGDIQYLDDATWTLTWSLASMDNVNAGFDLSATFTEGMDFAGWNDRGIPSGSKLGCAGPDAPQDWMYFLLSEGTLTGWGDYAGSAFSLSHQPASTFYGTQVGLGANHHNDAYGFGSTLTYSGTLLEQGEVVAESIQCCGDLHAEVECCLPFTLTRTYTATDCAGNTSSFSYQIVSAGDPCPEVEGSEEQSPEVERSPAPAPVEAAGLQMGVSPNPAGDEVQLRFALDEATEVTVTVLDLSGQVVLTLGAQSVEPGVEHTLDFQVGSLPAGLYQLRVQGGGQQASRSLFVVR